MAQNAKKRHVDAKKVKPVFVRGLKPSTAKWLREQIDDDNPSLPKVVKKIVEDEHRRKTERKD